MDLDAFECPICRSLFEGSIFQCKNGHAVCDACRVRIRGSCPFFRKPVGKIRCRPLENAIASMALPCSFKGHGCTQLLKQTERRHQEAFLCQHACPFQGCAYSGLLLYDHIQDKHNFYSDNPCVTVSVLELGAGIRLCVEMGCRSPRWPAMP